MSQAAEQITVAELDGVIAELAQKEAEAEEISLQLKAKNKEIAALEAKISSVLELLERDEYDCPVGKISIEEILSVKNPSDENKHLLWSWMREKGVYDRYAQVHATALKSLFKEELALAIKNGEDPLTFALPGMEPATFFRKIKFKPRKA